MSSRSCVRWPEPSATTGAWQPIREGKPERRGETTHLPIYGVDALVRRAPALQATRAAQDLTARGG